MFCHFQSKVDLFLEGACTGDDHVVERLAGYKRCILARHPLTQASILHLAVIFNHTNVLQLLLARKTAPINAQDMVCSIYSRLFTMCQSPLSRRKVEHLSILHMQLQEPLKSFQLINQLLLPMATYKNHAWIFYAILERMTLFWITKVFYF